MTEASRHLRHLAAQIAAAYVSRIAPRAVLLTRSAAQGTSDWYSDLDLILYHDGMPSEDAFRAVRESVGVERFTALGPWTESEYGEDYFVGGVECQVGHTTVTRWRETGHRGCHAGGADRGYPRAG